MDFIQILSDLVRAAFSAHTAVLALAAIGLNLHFGYTGLLNFGQAGFMLVGAYGIAVSVVTFGLSFWAALAISIVLSLLLAMLLGAPTLRLRADYFAIASLAVTESLRFVVRSGWMAPVTGGVNGLQRFGDDFYALNPLPDTRFQLGPLTWSSDQLFMLLVAWVCVLLAVAIVWFLVNSPWGRVVRSIKQNEDAARSLGRPVVRFKMESLAIGGLIGSAAGALMALQQQDVNPDGFMPVMTFFAYAALIIGGIGRTWGPVVGAIIFWSVMAGADSLMAQIDKNFAGLLSAQQLGAMRFVIFGAGLMLLVAYLSRGLLGKRTKIGGTFVE